MRLIDMAEYDRAKGIQRLTGEAFARVVFDAELRSNQPKTIECGVIFVHAFWAGSSSKTLADFCKSIVRVDTDSRLRFVVCDIDEIPPLDPILYRGDTSGGNGDVFWIAHVQVIARHTASRSCDFDTANQSLLQWCDAPRRNIDTAVANTEMG